MILQSLVKYYDRLNNDPDVDIPSFGYSKEKISFCLVINEEGKLLQVKDLRIMPEKGKAKPKLLSVPKLKGRSGKNPPPYFLWDNTKYILGVERNAQKNSEQFAVKTQDRFEAFRAFHNTYESTDVGYQALLKFLETWDSESIESISNIEDILNDTGNLVFQLDSEKGYLHDRPAIKKIWQKVIQDSRGNEEGLCLVSGENTSIALTHPLIKGVYGAQAAGAAMVSFNKRSFESFQKKQNINSPVGDEAAFAYTTTLNYLLDSANNQRLQIGDTSTVFWSERESVMETLFGAVMDPKDNGFSQDLKDFLDSIKKGEIPKALDGEKTNFYVLGLAPNAARVSIRFWEVSTVEEIARKIGRHFSDFEIVKSHEKNPSYPGMWKLLVETAVLNKTENVQPLLAGALMRSIINGLPYPDSLQNQLITRIRADQKITYIRVGLLKAIFNRKLRYGRLTITDKEVTVALDLTNTQPAYLLGRLFSVLERAQQDAIPGANSTIKDRYFGSASATPKIVFPILIKGAQNHFKKVRPKFYTESLVGQILEGIQEFPSNLALDEQGLFSIGYYHQRQDFYTKKTKEKKETK